MVSVDANAPLVAVIDGEPAIISLLTEALSEYGLRAIGLALPAKPSPVAELTAFLLHHAPNAVLLDITPPYKATWALLRAAHQAVPEASIVVLTTSPESVSALARSDGSVKVIGKPFELDDVLSAVRETLASSQDRQEAAS